MALKRYLQKLAERLSINYDHDSDMAYGTLDGVMLSIVQPNKMNESQIIIYTSVQKDDAPMSRGDLVGLQQLHSDVIQTVECKGTSIAIITKAKGVLRQETAIVAHIKVMQSFVAMVNDKGFVNCCQSCGSLSEISNCAVNSSPAVLCQSHYDEVAEAVGRQAQQAQVVQGNMLMGLLGAFLGAMVGVLAIVLLAQIGFVASISGIVMAICAFKGYEKLGKKMNTLGMVLTIVMMLVLVFVAEVISVSVMVVTEYGGGLAEMVQIFVQFFDIVNNIPDGTALLVQDLCMLYLFTIIGIVAIVADYMKKRSIKQVTKQLI